MVSGAAPRTLLVTAVLVGATLLGSCGDERAPASPAARLDAFVTVASFNFSESVLLGEIYAQALEEAGVPVERRLDLGARELVQPALQQGMVDFVPEYLGSALAFAAPGSAGEADPARARVLLQAALDGADLVVTEPAAAQNRNGFVVTRELAEVHGLRRLSDLRPLAGDLTFGGPPECPGRRLCLAGLEEVYGLRFGEVEALDTSGPLTRGALRSGRVDVGLVLTTAAVLAGDDLVLLEDDRALQPAEHVAPVVRRAVVDRHGAVVVEVVEAVSAHLDQVALIGLNRRLARGAEPAEVAAAWLASLDDG